MNYETFKKNISFIKSWRLKNDKPNWMWPDSRDPEVVEQMADLQVVPQDVEKSMVALAAYREGSTDVYQGMSVIVHVIRNRGASGMFRSHLTQDPQFDSMNLEGHSLLDVYPLDPPGRDFDLLLTNLDDILQGKTVDLSQGAIYFGELGKAGWFQDLADSGAVERTVQLGFKTFYKDKK